MRNNYPSRPALHHKTPVKVQVAHQPQCIENVFIVAHQVHLTNGRQCLLLCNLAGA